MERTNSYTKTISQNDSTVCFEAWKTRWEQCAAFGATFIVWVRNLSLDSSPRNDIICIRRCLFLTPVHSSTYSTHNSIRNCRWGNTAIKMQPPTFSVHYTTLWRQTNYTRNVKVKFILVQALGLCTGRTAHRGSRDIGKGKVHPCTGTEALYRPYGT